MIALYVALANLVGTLIAGKIQQDSIETADRQRLKKSVDDLWDKVDKAHIEIQTGAKQSE